MSGEEVTFLAGGLAWMSVTAVTMQWWFEARTMWLARLSARGLLAGTYTPAPTNFSLGGLKWVFRQRLPASDLVRMAELEDEIDEDRVTEAWRVRTTRRMRVALATGLGGLLTLALGLTLYELLAWQTFLVVVLLAAAAALVPVRGLILASASGVSTAPI